MIKKLAKYGNSNAIVLDKALLEILNITDTTKLKLSTDGKSLIITPLHEESANSVNISETPEEANLNYAARMHESNKTKNTDWNELEKLSREDRFALMEEIRTLSEQSDYSSRMSALGMHPDYAASIKAFGETARKQNLSAEEYHKGLADIMDQCDPGLSKVAQKIDEARTELFKKYVNKVKKQNSSN